MDKKKMETLVLIVGVLVVGAALTVYFLFGDNPQKAVISNIIFAIGFLFYIAYNTITTSGLQKEIKDLKSNIEGLKSELENRRVEIGELQKNLQEKENALNSKTQEAEQLESDLRALQKEFDTLKSKLEEQASEE
jgi:peptidoglycan hydrolase CwlO-like protein